MPAETNVTSFVVRFVQEKTPDSAGGRSRTEWHGTIKHVQTNTEGYFTCIAEAVAFMENYVNVEAKETPHRPEPEAKDSGSSTTAGEQA
jgi:hypothetical protein